MATVLRQLLLLRSLFEVVQVLDPKDTVCCVYRNTVSISIIMGGATTAQQCGQRHSTPEYVQVLQ